MGERKDGGKEKVRKKVDDSPRIQLGAMRFRVKGESLQIKSEKIRK